MVIEAMRFENHDVDLSRSRESSTDPPISRSMEAKFAADADGDVVDVVVDVRNSFLRFPARRRWTTPSNRGCIENANE